MRKPRKLPDDILAEKEILAMIDAAENLRDKALIAMLYEGGFRISELGTMTLIWSMPYIAQWLEMHPRREEREAPLWIKMSNSQGAFYGVS